MDRYDQTPTSVNPPAPSPPNRPSSPSSDDLRAAALKAHTLARVLCDHLLALDAGVVPESLQVLATLNEDAALESFELTDRLVAAEGAAQ